MASKAQIRASIKWNRSQDSITIRPAKEIGEQIRAAAADSGESVTAYILEAVRRRMESEQAAPSEWVSVNDRLPEGGEVLVYDPEVREVAVAFYESGRWIGRGYNEEHTVTHWQPLPAPPTVSGTPESDTSDSDSAARQ